MDFNRKVINGVYETRKMLVRISDVEVVKHFKATANAKLRYSRDRDGLATLSGIDRFPVLLSHDDNSKTLTMSRLPGVAVETFTPAEVPQLRSLVDTIIAAGVARHTLKARDIVRGEDGILRMVDFERTTQRKNAWTPVWWIARHATKYQLIQLIQNVDASQLNNQERKSLKFGNFARNMFRPLKTLRQKYKQRRLRSDRSAG